MEAVWRRLVFHFLWALAILLTGILSGLRVNAVSFAFFASRSLTSLEIFADPPQTPPASLLCPLHGHFAAFSPFWKNCANIVCPSDPKLGGQSHSFATFQVCGEPGKCSKASCEWYYAWPQVVSMSIFPNCFSEFSSKSVFFSYFLKNVFSLPSQVVYSNDYSGLNVIFMRMYFGYFASIIQHLYGNLYGTWHACVPAQVFDTPHSHALQRWIRFLAGGHRPFCQRQSLF